jgi:ABC-type transport system substrate-binding protein
VHFVFSLKGLPIESHHMMNSWRVFQNFCLCLVLGLTCAAGLANPNPRANPADPEKVLRVAFPAPESGFDPVRVNDLYSNTITAAIFQPLLTYDWMAMPTQIVPNAAESMPVISADNKTYTFKVKKGLYFTPDEAFKGQRRELTAQDFVYTLLRHADPKNRSPQVSDFDDKIFGFAESRKKAVASGQFDYEQKHPGIYALDRYTLVIQLVQPDRNFLTLLTSPFAGAMAREVVEKYGFEGVMSNPVGTGPYILEKWVRGSKPILNTQALFGTFNRLPTNQLNCASPAKCKAEKCLKLAASR